MEANPQLWFAPHNMHFTLPFPVKGRVDKFHIISPEKLGKDQIDFHESEAVAN